MAAPIKVLCAAWIMTALATCTSHPAPVQQPATSPGLPGAGTADVSQAPTGNVRARTRILPFHGECESAGIIDGSLFTAAGKHGLLGFSVPEKLGGSAVDDFRYNAILVEEEGQPHTVRQQLLLALAVAEFVGMLAIAVVVAKLSRQAIRPLATALALQRRFVDDASHELRRV